MNHDVISPGGAPNGGTFVLALLAAGTFYVLARLTAAIVRGALAARDDAATHHPSGNAPTLGEALNRRLPGAWRPLAVVITGGVALLEELLRESEDYR